MTDHTGLLARRCPNGHVSYPGHPVCGVCGESATSTVDLSDRTGEVVTWTVSTATPPGVRAPNAIAIVAFEVDGGTVTAIGQVTTEDVAVGDRVEPVYEEELREPEQAIRATESQHWDGYRFEPID